MSSSQFMQNNSLLSYTEYRSLSWSYTTSNIHVSTLRQCGILFNKNSILMNKHTQLSYKSSV